MTKLLLMLCFVVLTGCAGTFEEAKVPNRCETLSVRRDSYLSTGAALGIVSGGTALIAVPGESAKVKRAVLIGTAVSTLTGATFVLISDHAGRQWEKECSTWK